MSVSVETTDRRKVVATFPADPADLARAMEGMDGYRLVDARVQTGGHQGFVVATGVTLTFVRDGS